MIFYKNSRNANSYKDLLKEVGKRSWVDTAYLAQDYFDFILNVIVGMVNDVDLVLVDFRNITGEESSSKIEVAPIDFENIENLVGAIKSSKSNIGIYSSGTTAKPKLINQTINRLLKSVRISEEYHNSRWGFTYNPSHSAGIQVFLQATCNQATLYDLYKCSRSEIIETFTQEKITHLSATPTFYRMLAPYNFNLSYIKSITFNGEKSTVELINAIKGVCHNARIRNIYGSTESGPLMSSESTTFIVPERLLDHIKIENDELLIKSEFISKSVAKEDWYHTGDLVRVISEHPLTIEFVTRKSKVLNVGGQNVSPQEVEETLLLHPAVKDVRVYGRPNKMIGNLVVAEVQILGGMTVVEKDLVSYCKLTLAAYKVPRMIKVVEKIGVGRTGKKML